MTELAAVRSEETQKSQVDNETTERFISEKHIGERIKRLRLKKSMGLVELGRHTGLSASFLSQLETGRVVPTLRNLARIAMVFSKDLSYFFETEPQAMFRVHRRKERVRLPQTGVDDPLISLRASATWFPTAIWIPTSRSSFRWRGDEARAHMHPGYEFLYLLEGQLDLRHGEHHCTLEPGDAVYFDSSTPHSYVCVGKEAGRCAHRHHAPAAANPAGHAAPPGSSARPAWKPGPSAVSSGPAGPGRPLSSAGTRSDGSTGETASPSRW